MDTSLEKKRGRKPKHKDKYANLAQRGQNDTESQEEVGDTEEVVVKEKEIK